MDAYVVNRSNSIPDPYAVQRFVETVNIYVTHCFHPVWGTEGQLFIGGSGTALIRLQDQTDYPQDLGYHIDAGGNPNALVDVALCLSYHTAWEQAAAHEYLEMLVNPLVTSFAGMYLKEVCDPVSNDTINFGPYGLAMPNFVFPDYFVGGSQGPWDYFRHLTGPCPTLGAMGIQMYRTDANQYDTLTAGPPADYFRNRTDGRRAWAAR
jgi:hypothetical protein